MISEKIETEEPSVNDPTGGKKSDILPEVVPYVARQLSDLSLEDMRTDTEDELRSVAKAVDSLTSFVRALEARIPPP